MKRTKPNYYNKPTKLPRGSRNVGTSRGTLTDNENITETIDTIDSLIVKLTELKDSQNSRIYNENINESIDSPMVDLTELMDSVESVRVVLAEMKERIARFNESSDSPMVDRTELKDSAESLRVVLAEMKERIARLNESSDSPMVDLTKLKDSQESPRVGLAEMKERFARLKKTGCGCKGNCSSRICGCVKKSNKCGPSCKCDVDLCHNQKSEGDQENKENKTLKALKKQSRKNDCLFSPD